MSKGLISPSQFSRIMVASDLKKGIDVFGPGAMTYAMELALQRIGVELPEARASALDWGNEHEWEAKRVYEQRTMATVDPIAEAICHPTLNFVGGTPDGLVGGMGIIEVKCPFNPVNHMRNMLEPAQYETDYKEQVQGYLWITEREWCDFVSFDPRFPEKSKIAIHRILRDELLIELLEVRCIAFWDVVKRNLDVLGN